ncbi:MAG TPA: SPFH domain-containing protein [Herpetosiphonaceae bacterium]
MNRLSPSVLLSIMVTSLLFIFIGPGNFNLLVGGCCLAILGVGLVLGFSGGTPAQRESSRNMLGTLTGIVAISSAALMGQFILNNRFGLICAPILLASLYLGFLTLIARSGIHVEEGEVLLIQRRMGHQHILRPPGLHSPLLPALEEGIAVMPSYVIQTEIEVDEVDTSFLHKVDKICVDTACRIIQRFPEPGEDLPVESRYEGFLKLPYNYPNRDHVFRDLAAEREKQVVEARMQTDFWIEAIQRQLAKEVGDELRAVIHEETFYDPDRHAYSKLGPSEISSRRAEIATLVKQRVQEKVNSWGVEVLDLSLNQIQLNPERIRFHYLDAIHGMDDREAERKARQEAVRQKIMAETELEMQHRRLQMEADHSRQMSELETEHMSDMLKSYIDSLMAENPNISQDDVKRLLFLMLEEQKLLQMRGGKR